jgi:PKD repeat protein
VTWGDEYSMPWASSISSASPVFYQSTTFTHAYSSAGVYTIKVAVRDSAGLSANTSTTVKVGSDAPVACTMEYAPVCGQPTGCANTCAPGMFCAAMCQMPEPQTYSNKCMMNAAGATFKYIGECQVAATTIPWSTALNYIYQCQVSSAAQTHSRVVYLGLKDGTSVQTTEPSIDDVFSAARASGCPSFPMATE